VTHCPADASMTMRGLPVTAAKPARIAILGLS
jgi:hypothetical protein